MCLTKENMLYWSINLSDDAEARYYTYEFKDKKHIIIKTLMQKHTTNLMSLTIKKRICINRFRKGEKMKKLIGLLMILCMVLLYSCSGQWTLQSILIIANL